MTPDQIRQIEVSSRRNRGPDGAHPDAYLCAGSALTFGGVDFAAAPLYPSGATRILPRFDGDDVTLDVQTDTALVDEALVTLAGKLRSLAPVDQGDLCPACGQPVDPRLVVDPAEDVEFLRTIFCYARRCLLRMYDLSAEQLAALLTFDSTALPQWIAQVLDHALGRPGRDG